jgi:hypothetical protein
MSKIMGIEIVKIWEKEDKRIISIGIDEIEKKMEKGYYKW